MSCSIANNKINGLTPALSAAEYILSISVMNTILVISLQCYSFGVLVQNREKSI